VVVSRDASVVRRFVVVALAVPTVFTVASLSLVLAWKDQLPDPIATHWGGSGGPDGYGSFATAVIAGAILGLGLPFAIGAATLPMLRRGARGANFRAMGSIAAAVSALFAVLNTWTVGMQRGLTSAHDAPHVFPALFAAFGAAALVGALGWVIQPAQHTVVPGLSHAEPLPLAPGERAIWMRSATMALPFKVLLYSILGALALASAGLWVAGQSAAAWIYVGTMAMVALAMAATATFHVQVDATGLSAVSALGFPRLGVATEDVADAGVAEVNGFAEFGGWGVRQRPGAVGIILRNGESLQVTRMNGKRLVITVDDAATAAALLNAFAVRAHSGNASS